MMNEPSFSEKILQLASIIGEQFHILNLLNLLEFPIEKINEILTDRKFVLNFDEVNTFVYKFKDRKKREEILKNLNPEYINEIKSSSDQFTCGELIKTTKLLFESESKKLSKHHILGILVSYAKYLFDKKFYELSLNILDFIIEYIDKTTRTYEEALFIKASVHSRLYQNKEVISTCDKIVIFPDFIYKKYDLLVDFYFENGEQEKSLNIINDWKTLIERDKTYRFLEQTLKRYDILYRTAQYNNILAEIKELEEGEVSLCLSFGTIYGEYTVAQFYSLKGLTLYAQENYPKALEALIKSSNLFKKNNFQRNLLSTYNNIAEIYKIYKKYDQANKIYQKIIETSTRLGDTDALAAATWNIGESYFFQQDYSNAESYFSKGEQLFYEAGTYERYENYIKLFWVKLFMLTNRKVSAKTLVDEVTMSAYERGEMKEYADSLLLKGELISYEGEDPSHYFDEAISIYKKLGLKSELVQAEKSKLKFMK